MPDIDSIGDDLHASLAELVDAARDIPAANGRGKRPAKKKAASTS
jgi:hypothetical protein